MHLHLVDFPASYVSLPGGVKPTRLNPAKLLESGLDVCIPSLLEME